MAYRSQQRAAPKRNRQETIISISAQNRPTNGAASSLTFADLPEGLALKAQGFVKPGRLLIDGGWVEAVSGKTFETFNPATEERLGHVAHGAAEDIELAVTAARRAFDDERSDWRRMTPSERGKVIHRIGDLIEKNADELAMLETLDNGKPLAIAKAADVALSADLFHYMSGWATKIEGHTIPISAVTSPGLEFLAYTRMEPIGVVGQIIPWNFPLLMAAWKLGPALAAGATIVLKPAEQTPLSALRLGELMTEAGVPAGVVNIVTGFGDAGRGDRCPRRRRQGRLHGLDRGRQADRAGRRGQSEEGHARAGWQEPARALQGRRHGRRDSGCGQRHLLQPGPVL